MGAIADLAVPQEGAISALPVPGQVTTPDNLDVDTFNATAGPVRQGLRSGFNSLGVNMNTLMGQTGEALGLTEFANDRFKDAANFADFADRVGSPVRDWGQVKDAQQLSKFVAGMTGEALASSAPAAAASLALRRPIAGITAGTLPFSAGQQIARERANPKAGDTPGSVLEHGLEKGAVDSALYGSIGAIGQGARKVLSPKLATKGGIGSALAEGAGGNAAAGAASSVASDKIAGDEPDWNTALNAAIGNAVPGAIIAGAGHAIGAIPGAAARSTDELRARLGKKSPPPDINAEPKIEDLNDNTSVDEIAAMLGDNYDKGMEGLHNVWDKVKSHPGAQKFKDYATDEESRQNFNDEIQKSYKESTYKPKVDAAVAAGKNWMAGAQKFIDAKFNKPEGGKKSEMRTKVDDDIHDAMLAAMPIDHLEAASPEQLLQLGGVIKKMAENPDYFAETGVPHALRSAFGPAFKGLMDIAVDRVHGPESRKAAKEKIADVFKKHDDMEGMQMEEAQNLVRTHLKKDYLAKPGMRDAAIDELGPKLLDYINREGKTAPAAQFHDAMQEAFGDKTDKVLAGLDRMHEEARANRVFDGSEILDDEGNPVTGGPVADPRLDRVYKKSEIDEADKAIKELTAEYGQKNVKITKVVNRETNEISLHLEHADEVGLDKQSFNRVRESFKTNRTGIENGVLTVKNDDHPSGAKVNISKLTGEMMRREGQMTQDTGPKYIADMFKRGIAALMASDGFHGFTEKGGLAEGTFPDKTPVAYVRGKEYTFGDIKDAGKLSKWDIAGFTREHLIQMMDAMREGSNMNEAQLRKMASKKLIEGVRAQDMRETLVDRMDQRKEAVQFTDNKGNKSTMEKKVGETRDGEEMFRDVRRNKAEGDDLEVKPQPGMRDRELKDKQGEMIPRTYEEDTAGAVGADLRVKGPSTFMLKDGTKVHWNSPQAIAEMRAKGVKEFPKEAPPEFAGKTLPEPHGKGPINEKDKKVALTKLVQDGLNSANPAVQKAREELTKGWAKKYSKMKVGSDLVLDKYDGESGDPEGWTFKDAKSGERMYFGGMEKHPNELYDLIGHYPTKEEAMAALDAYNATQSDKLSTMNIGDGPQTEEMRQAVREQVKKVLGPDADVIFEKLADANGSYAGEFIKGLDSTETLKISIDASDPMSVGHHESVHALMSRLVKADKKAAHALLRAADAAPIVARLHELLADHPEALKQLKDPEERLAYMYQFWATGHKGLMSIGPNTRTFFEKVKGFFQKIASVWSDDMGSAMAVQRANDLFIAFHNGEFAERSAVGDVLARRFPPDPESQLRTFWPGIGRFMDKAIYTAGGAVRDMNIPAFTEIMDKFHTVQGDLNKPTGFSQVRHVMYDQYMNRVSDALKGLDEAGQKALTEELQGDGPRTTPAAKAIEQINKELFTYLTSKGVETWNGKGYQPIREVSENYWHRMPNQDYLRSDAGREAFIKMLHEHDVKDAVSVWEKWSRDADSGKPEEGDAVLGLSFYTPQINERKLQNIPNSAIAPFLDKDVFGVMHQYVQRAVRRAEYTERFGNRGEVIEAARAKALEQGVTPEQMKIFEASVQAHEGTLGADIPIKLRSTYAAVMTYQNLRLLPLQLFSSFVDPLGIMVRGGTVKDAVHGLTRGFRELIGTAQDEHFDLAKTMGTISSSLDNSIASSLANAHYMPKAARWVNEKFFKYNGMESWNRSQRIVATVAAHDFIVRHVENPGKHSARFLAELNLDPKKVKVTDGQLDGNDKAVRAAINQWVDESILRPTAAHRPIYMSDPHWMLVSHLKQYSYLFQKVILSRVYNELQHKNYSPAFALAGYVPTIIAADMARMMITPTPNDDSARAAWGAKDWIWSGIQRAGIFGPGQMAIGSAMDARQDRIPGQNLFGPSVEQLVDFVRASAQGTGVSNQVANAIPGIKLIKGSRRETLPMGDE